MKVACYFGGRTNLGGAERRIGRIMNQIAQKGIEVTFVFYLYEDFTDVQKEYHQMVGEPFHIKLVGFNKQLDLVKFVKKSHFDTVFYTGPNKDMLPFFFAGKLSGSQMVFLQVSTGPSIGRFGSFFEKMEFELIARLSTRIDCLYPSTTEAIRKRYSKQIVTTTPCPSTDLTLFCPATKEKSLAFISRWVPGKNVLLFLESMLLIEDKIYENGYKVILCGSSRDGKIEKEVGKLLEKSRYPQIYVLTGYVQSINVLPFSEVFFSLQNINNYPSQSLLEAISCGCYIIASNEGDTRLLVKDEYGVLVDLDAEQISAATMQYIVEDQKHKNEFSVEARRFAEREFDINKSVNHYYDIIFNNVK